MAVEQSDRHPIAFRAAGRVEPLFPSQPSIQTFSRDWEPDLFQWEKQRLFETREALAGQFRRNCPPTPREGPRET